MMMSNLTTLRRSLVPAMAVCVMSAVTALAGAANPDAPAPAPPPAAQQNAPPPGAPAPTPDAAAGVPGQRAPAAAVAAPGAGSGDTAADAAAVAASASDWPCVQVKVHTIDSAAVWDGPPVQDLKDWNQDDKLSDVAATAISRRTPLPDAEKAIEAYAKSLPDAERDQKLTLLFAGILDTANVQRNSIIGGIERYQKRQRSNAKEIESQGAAIADLEAKAPSDLTQPTPELDAAREKYDWFARVFQERQANVPIACELPTLIEQRVFAVARAIRAQMKS